MIGAGAVVAERFAGHRSGEERAVRLQAGLERLGGGPVQRQMFGRERIGALGSVVERQHGAAALPAQRLCGHGRRHEPFELQREFRVDRIGERRIVRE